METRTDIPIKERQQRILEIMKDIDRFCRANNIPYTISSGTLLGAVRHGGFIPWDDDADMFMLRKDFDRFVSIYKSDKYQLSYNLVKPDGFHIIGYAKVNDSTAYTLDRRGREIPGLFVDIFPLDDVPEDPELRHKFMHRLMRYENRIYHRQRNDIVSILKSYFHSMDWWKRRLLEAVQNNPYAGSPLVGHAVGTRNYRTVINRDRFDSLTDIMFEGYPFLGFSDTHSYLEMVYGPDYMTPKKWSHNIKVYNK